MDTMRPTSSHLLLFLSLSSILLHPTTSHCVPRTSAHPLHPSLLGSPKTADSPRPAEPTAAPVPCPTAASPSPASAQLSPITDVFESAIKGICSHTDHPDLCLSSVRSYLPIPGDVDAAVVLGMLIKACTHHTEVARSVSFRIQSDPATGKSMASILESCTESYDDALSNLKNAAKAMESRDVATLNSMLSAASTDFSTCDEGFMEMPGFNSPMTSYDDFLSKLASNCLAIAELIKK